MAEIGIYGGTFAPVHLGHIRAAETALASLPLDKLLIIPAGIPPHKRLTAGDDPADRLEMLRLAFADADPRIEISDYEINAEGKSYTALTLKHFSENGDHLTFFCGTDMFESLDTWYHPETVFSLARVVHLRREVTDAEDLKRFGELQRHYEETYGADILQLDAEPLVMSSTEVRSRIEAGLSLDEFLPSPVAEYVRSHRLYGAPYREEALAAEVARVIGNEYRFSHTLGVVKEAARLAEMFSLPPEEAEELKLAAYLHDITKSVKGNGQKELYFYYGLPFGETEERSPKTLHAVTGAYFAKERFPALVSDRIFNAIRRHTTGEAGMTLFDKLLYLADYIEEGRSFPDCVALRELFTRLIGEKGVSEAVLDETMIRSFDMTLEGLMKDGDYIHPQTVAARNSLV